MTIKVTVTITVKVITITRTENSNDNDNDNDNDNMIKLKVVWFTLICKPGIQNVAPMAKGGNLGVCEDWGVGQCL